MTARVFGILAALCVVAALCPARADALHLVAGGMGVNDSNGSIITYGVKADCYMYPKPSPLYDDWVNSVSAHTDAGYFVETGWYWRPSVASRRWFKFGITPNQGWLGETALTVTGVQDGERPQVTIRRTSTSGSDWVIFINGVTMPGYSDTGMTSTRAHVMAERYNWGDENKGSYQYVSYLATAFTWAYWPNAWVYRPDDIGYPALLDPDYYLHTQYVDRSDHFLYIDD